MAAKKKRAMESPATTTQRLLREACSSAMLRRCAPHRSASLDHCQLSVWLGPHVATLSVLGSHLHSSKLLVSFSATHPLTGHILKPPKQAILSALGSHLHHPAEHSPSLLQRLLICPVSLCPALYYNHRFCTMQSSANHYTALKHEFTGNIFIPCTRPEECMLRLGGGRDTHPTLGIPTQFPELKRASQNLS